MYLIYLNPPVWPFGIGSKALPWIDLAIDNNGVCSDTSG